MGISVAKSSSLCDRVEQHSQLAGGAVAPRQPAVDQVGKRRDEEDDERDDLGPVALDKWEQCDDWRETDARERDDVRQCPPHRGGTSETLGTSH